MKITTLKLLHMLLCNLEQNMREAKMQAYKNIDAAKLIKNFPREDYRILEEAAKRANDNWMRTHGALMDFEDNQWHSIIKE